MKPTDTPQKPPAPRTCRILRAGCLDYATAWEWQRRLVAERSAGNGEDTLLLLEHPPTITLGRAAHREHVLATPDELARLGITLVESNRGGDVTYHAPGQLVGYPILKLAHYGGNVLAYLRNLEEVVIRTLARYGIEGRRVDGLTGVWVQSNEASSGDSNGKSSDHLAKIAAIGVHFSASGITSHGFALNVAPNLRGFATIIPCGIRSHGVTSLHKLLGWSPSLDEVAEHTVACFVEVFGIAHIIPVRGEG